MEAVISSAIMQELRTLPPFRNCLVLLGLALLLAPLAASQEKPSTLLPAPADQEQIVAYWTTETGWKSDLQLRNNQIGRELTVTPVLRTAYGAETSLSAITIKPEEVKTIDLDAAIGTTAPQLVGTYGSLVLRYRSPGSRSLYASLMVRNIGHPFAFHIDAMGELENYEAASREGIWWLPNDTASDFLILTNQGKNLIQFDLSLYDATGKETKQKLALGPRETTRYSIRKLVQAAGLTGSYGGIKIFAATHAGSFDSLHVLFDEKAGFSALLKMFDHDPNAKLDERDFAQTAVWTLRAPMLALSNPDPALAFPPGTTLRPQFFIRNTTGKPVDAALRFNWRTDRVSGRAAGPALRLNPYETRRIDVAGLQDGAILPKEANWTSVTLTTKSLPDEVMAVAASYDDTLRYGAQTPFSDQLSFRWEGGMWEYDPYHNSLVTAGNGGTKPTLAAFTIFYNQGAEKYELEQTLQPDEQMWIDIGKLIREHVPDKNGKTLPADLNSGSYEFRDLSDIGVGSLFEGKLTYDRTYGHVSYGGCSLCCGYQSAFLTYDPLSIPFGGTSQNGVGAYETCAGSNSDVSSYFTNNWSVVNTAIATVDTSGKHTGVSIGSTTSNTRGLLATGQQRNCPASRLNAESADIVTPGITKKQIPNVILPSDPTSPNLSSVSNSGMLSLTNQSKARGAAGTGTVNLYTKTANKQLYYKDDPGTEIGPIGAAAGGRVTATGNNAFTGNNTMSNWNNMVIVDGVKYPQTDAGIQSAINAAAHLGGGSTVFLPAGTYTLKSSLPITISTRVNIIGSGWGTQLAVDSSVGATTDIFLVQPTGNSTISGVRIQDFFITSSGASARHAFNLNGANGEVVDFIFDHVIVQPKLGGNAINASGSGLAQGTPVLTTIQNSVLTGGIVMSNAGDTIRILNNQITGAGPAIDVSFQPGASTFIVSGNNITSDGGIHLGTSVVGTQIFSNEIETFDTFTGSNRALIDVDGPSSLANDVTIAWNSLQVVNGITANGIRVNNANSTHIFWNRFGRGAGASKDISITASATNTFVGTNLWVAGGPFSSMVSDFGTSTVLATEFGGGFVINRSHSFSSIDNAGNQRPLASMASDGSSTFYGYHSLPAIIGVNGATYIYDGQSSALPVAAFTRISPSAQPEAGGVITVPTQAFKEITAPGGTAGFETCYGDSTAHALKCSYNNDSFGTIPKSNNAAPFTVGLRAPLVIADQGTACANGNLALSAGWGSTATVTGAAGTGQTCEFTLTSAGTGQAANATITDTLPTALPTANTVCTAQLTGGTGIAALSGAGLFINQTTLSETAPAFTFPGLPVGGATYFVVIRCGP